MSNSLYMEQISLICNSALPWNKFKDAVIIISGATGMVGKTLIDVLVQRNRQYGDNIKIIALSRNYRGAKDRLGEYLDNGQVEYLPCDVNDKIPECGHADYIIHAASNTHPLQYAKDSIGTITANVIGTKNLLDYAVAYGTRQFCFISSVEIYGENRGDIEKFSEDYLGYIDSNSLRAGYPESKRLGEALCNAYGNTFSLKFVIPRLSRVYGPTMLMEDTKAISQFIKKAASGQDILLKSEGTQIYSYSFVTDAVSGILYTMLLGKGGNAYNVADPDSDISLKELAWTLADIAKTQLLFEAPSELEKKGYSTATKAMLNAGKLKGLGWEPRVHMREGLECTIDYLKTKRTGSKASN